MSNPTRTSRSARTLIASGRFVVLAFLAGCQIAGGTSGAAPADPGLPDPVISGGPISDGAIVRAANLFRIATDAFDAGRFVEAAETTGEIVEEYPAAPVSGRALLLRAQALQRIGDGAGADAAAERYIELLPPADPRIAAARLVQMEALTGDPAALVDRVMRLPPDTPPTVLDRAGRLLRAAGGEMDLPGVEAALAAAPLEARLRSILEVRAGALSWEAGDDAAAARYAERALALGVSGPDSVVAEGLMRGELPGGQPRTTQVRIATVLPTSGPPALADYARLVAEGIEVAAATALGSRYAVEIVARDDEAFAERAAEHVSELQRDDVEGIVGFLQDDALEMAGQVRGRTVPLVSPTARSAARAGEGVYSLEGPDPIAAATMARYAAEQGYMRVAIVHSQAPASTEEASAFEAAMTSLGVPVVGRFAYPRGATNFEDQIIGARDALRKAEIEALELGEEDTLHVELLEPVAVFVPIPTEDVEFVAPQLSHYALDTLAIDILGTSAWTDPQVLAEVDNRHTSGVVATAPEGRGPDAEGRRLFREAYEAHFQRSLVSPVPAVGYDAALLLLEGLRDRPASNRALRGNIERLRDVRGATGVFSVIGGKVVRRTEVVYIDNGILVPIG